MKRYRPRGYYPSNKYAFTSFSHIKLNINDVILFLDMKGIPYTIENKIILVYKKKFSRHRVHDTVYIGTETPELWINKLNALVESYNA